MTDVATSADIVRFRKPALTNAQRQQAWRDRQRAAKLAAAPAPQVPAIVMGKPAEWPVKKSIQKPAPVTIDAVTSVTCVTPRRFEPSTWVLRAASVALAGVGLSMNAVYAHSLGSSDLSGWLFLALGVAADASALVLPSVAASAPERIQRFAGWSAFAAVFAFAILASVGFASTSISDVTTARNGRVTPAVTAAERALADAQGARDRECKSGTGKFCREREAAVAAARTQVEQAMAKVEQQADPQTASLVRIVTWASRGSIAPSEGDVAMIRLILFALLPQIGGILLMVSRRP